jgi:hypothetical protein
MLDTTTFSEVSDPNDETYVPETTTTSNSSNLSNGNNPETDGVVKQSRRREEFYDTETSADFGNDNRDMSLICMNGETAMGILTLYFAMYLL